VSTSLRQTPLHAIHVALGARMVPFAGWEMPVQYKGVTQEHGAVRNAVGLFDVSHMGELYFDGPAAGACIDSVVTNDVQALAVGRALYTVACNERGKILDDLIVYRLQDQRYLVVCNASNLEKMSAHFEQRVAGRCGFSDRSEQTALLALQGPRSIDVLRALDPQSRALALTRFGVAHDLQLAGVTQTVARTGYTGEDGFELFCASGDATRLWNALSDAGKACGLEPIGLAARDTLRLEARLSLYGHELDEDTEPLEAGLGWVVKLNKGDFLGREALQRAKAQPSPRKLVGFEMVGRGIARQGYPILDRDGRPVGIVTSGAPGLSVAKNIGLGYVPADSTAIGTSLGIEIRGKAVEARVCATPFYKRA
jgi:aminomethyltransferase